MRLISGIVRYTQTESQPILSNIAPLDLRKLYHTTKILQKLNSQTNLQMNIL